MKILLYGLTCLALVISLGGCFFWHTTDREPATHETTVITP